MLTICPSPFCPSTIAVTRTRVSLPTKFRMHLSYLLLWPVCAARSNLSAREKGRTMRNRRAVDRREGFAMPAFIELELMQSVRRVLSEAVYIVRNEILASAARGLGRLAINLRTGLATLGDISLSLLLTSPARKPRLINAHSWQCSSSNE